MPSTRHYKGKPKAAIQREKDKAYIAFQTSPRLPQTSKALLQNQPRCTTILGGKRIWLRGERPGGEQYRYPIIADGTKCDAKAASSFKENGRQAHRCRAHAHSEYWIPDVPEPTVYA